MLFSKIRKLRLVRINNIPLFEFIFWLYSPNWVLLQLLPVRSLQGVLLQQQLNKVIQLGWNFLLNFGRRVWLDHLNQCFQTTCVEGRLTSNHLEEHASQCPEIWRKWIYTLVLEKLRGHIVRSTLFLILFIISLWLRSFLGCQISDLLAEAKVTKFKIAELIYKDIPRF